MTYSMIVGKYKLIFSDTHFKDFRKKPTISVYDADTNSETKIASFNSKETFEWFVKAVVEADRKTEQTEPRLEQFRVGLEYHTDSVNFGKPKGESITTNKTEPQIEKCPFDDSLPCEWVCTEYGKCKYKPQTEPQTDCSWK